MMGSVRAGALGSLTLALMLAVAGLACAKQGPPAQIQTTLCEPYLHPDEFDGKRITVHALLVSIGDPGDSDRILLLADTNCPSSTFLVNYGIERIPNWASVLTALEVNGKSDVEGNYVGKASRGRQTFVIDVDTASNLKAVPPRNWEELQKAE
jgi:hypothetical protein